jgi:hypothetical protein
MYDVRSHPKSKRRWVKLEPLPLGLQTESSGQAWLLDARTPEWGHRRAQYGARWGP